MLAADRIICARHKVNPPARSEHVATATGVPCRLGARSTTRGTREVDVVLARHRINDPRWPLGFPGNPQAGCLLLPSAEVRESKRPRLMA